MIISLGKEKKARPFWHRKFVIFGLLRIEKRDSANQQLKLVVLRTLERRYSASSGSNIWREI